MSWFYKKFANTSLGGDFEWFSPKTVSITNHAVERFIQRVDNTCTSYDDARAKIRDALSSAKLLFKSADKSTSYYGDQNVVFVLSRPFEHGHARIVTVMTPNDYLGVAAK